MLSESFWKSKDSILIGSQAKTSGGNTALHFASMFHNLDAVKALLSDTQIDAFLINTDGKTPLFYIQKYEESGILTRDEEKESFLEDCRKVEKCKKDHLKNTRLHSVILQDHPCYWDVVSIGLQGRQHSQRMWCHATSSSSHPESLWFNRTNAGWGGNSSW